MTVDFDEVKKIPFASILAAYKIPFRKRSDTEIVCDCPLPSHAESAHKQTLAISTVKGKAFCHSEKCRAASNKPKGFDIIDFVQMYENLPNPLAAGKRLKEMFALPNNVSVNTHPPSKQNPPLTFSFKHLDPTHPYITQRGILTKTAEEFGVGFHSGKGTMAGRVCFPLREDGAIVGYAGRAVNGDEPKWLLPNGLVKSFLYGLERCDPSKPLYLVEGCWAVLFLAQNNAQAAAMLGSSLTEAQEQCLAPYAEIRVALDNDIAGREAAEKIVERLRPNHKVSKAFLRK